MKNQFEQHCNAAALSAMGVPVMKSLKKKHLPVLMDWIENDEIVEVNYEDETENIINTILDTHRISRLEQIPDSRIASDMDETFTIKKLKNLTLTKILSKLGH